MIYVGYSSCAGLLQMEKKRAKTAAVFNIFAATTVPFLLYIIPRQLPSLHPGADGNPAFSDMTAPELRIIFTPLSSDLLVWASGFMTLHTGPDRIENKLVLKKLQ